MDHKFFPLLHVLKDHDEPQQLIHVSIRYIYSYKKINRNAINIFTNGKIDNLSV